MARRIEISLFLIFFHPIFQSESGFSEFENFQNKFDEPIRPYSKMRNHAEP